MSKEKYIEDIREIKEMMDRSSRFISLSGWSGVSAGVFALIGAYIGYRTIYVDSNYSGYERVLLSSDNLWTLLLIALVTLFLSIMFGIYFTTRKARKAGQPIWGSTSKRLLVNLLIPLATGGILCMMLLAKGYIGLIAPLTLIFYGLSLINASKFTLPEIKSLGILEIILGLIAIQFIGYGLFFWAIGFGILHIIYGIIMHFRYEK